MGLFDFMKRTEHMIYAPMEGSTVALEELGVAGKGIAIRPRTGTLVAPCDCTVLSMAETGHEMCLKADFGAELRIRVGLNSERLMGQGFIIYALDGDTLKKGDLLLEFELEYLTRVGFDMTTPITVTNGGEYPPRRIHTGTLHAGDVLMEL